MDRRSTLQRDNRQSAEFEAQSEKAENERKPKPAVNVRIRSILCICCREVYEPNGLNLRVDQPLGLSPSHPMPKIAQSAAIASTFIVPMPFGADGRLLWRNIVLHVSQPKFHRHPAQPDRNPSGSLSVQMPLLPA